MSPETLIGLIRQALDDIEKGDDAGHWHLIDYLATYYAWHHPEDSERLRPFLRWRNRMVDKPKGSRKLAASEVSARARAAAYARAVSMRLKDSDAWRRMREALISMGYHPPNDQMNGTPGSGLNDWAMNSINKTDDYTIAKNHYENFCNDFAGWTDEQLAENEAYVVFELFDLILDEPIPVNRPPRYRE